VAAVEGLRHDQAYNRVSQELQALVVANRLVRVLVKPGAVDESAGQERLVAEGNPEQLGQFGRGSRRAGGLPRP
jgi:hypothetical protein